MTTSLQIESTYKQILKLTSKQANHHKTKDCKTTNIDTSITHPYDVKFFPTARRHRGSLSSCLKRKWIKGCALKLVDNSESNIYLRWWWINWTLVSVDATLDIVAQTIRLCARRFQTRKCTLYHKPEHVVLIQQNGLRNLTASELHQIHTSVL